MGQFQSRRRRTVMQQPTSNYTGLWERKMRKIFRSLDTKKLGYITEEVMEEHYNNFRKGCPEVDEAMLKEHQEHTWKYLFHNGRETPKGHRLTEEEFIKNMWVTVNQPNFIEEVERLAKESLDKMDLKHKGYLTKEEYLRMYSKSTISEERATAMFDAMDRDHKGELYLDDLVRAKHFYYTDVSDESHPFNLMHGPLDEALERTTVMQQPTSNYTDLWERKMRKVFRSLDTKQLGYITEEVMEEHYKRFREACPEVDEATLKEQQQHTWKYLFHSGRETPKGHRLTEEEFIKNMWVTVNQPNFVKEVEQLAKESFDKMDLKHKGHITKEEYLRMYSKSTISEERATAMFDAMDRDHKGEFHLDDLVRAKHFYYTDVADESHPFNLMHGPLDGPKKEPTH